MYVDSSLHSQGRVTSHSLNSLNELLADKMVRSSPKSRLVLTRSERVPELITQQAKENKPVGGGYAQSPLSVHHSL